MRKNILAMLVISAVAGSGVVLFTLGDGFTRADLVDAGMAGFCDKREIACVARTPNGVYRTKQFVGMWCDGLAKVDLEGGGEARVFGGGAVLKDSITLPAGMELLHCRPVATSTAAESDMVDVQDECACRRSTGACTVSDSSTLPFGRIAGPNYPAPFDTFTGAGCRRMPCVALSGEDTWPNNCPREDAGVPIR